LTIESLDLKINFISRNVFSVKERIVLERFLQILSHSKFIIFHWLFFESKQYSLRIINKLKNTLFLNNYSVKHFSICSIDDLLSFCSYMSTIVRQQIKGFINKSIISFTLVVNNNVRQVQNQIIYTCVFATSETLWWLWINVFRVHCDQDATAFNGSYIIFQFGLIYPNQCLCKSSFYINKCLLDILQQFQSKFIISINFRGDFITLDLCSSGVFTTTRLCFFCFLFYIWVN